METTETLTHFPQLLIGLAMIVVVAGLCWWIASAISKKKWKRYSLAEAEATRIRDFIIETHNSFKGKYMPPALRELLAEAWTDYSSLAQQAHSVDTNEELLALTAEVDDVLEKIAKQALVEPTAADWEADKLALDQELIEVEQKHEQSLEHLQNQFNDKKAHIAQRCNQLDEQWVASLDCNRQVSTL